MISFSQRQVDVLDRRVYERNALLFVTNELQLVDVTVSPQKVKALFEDVAKKISLEEREHRFLLVLLMIGILMRGDIFTPERIDSFLRSAMNANARLVSLCSILKKYDYDSALLLRKSWV